MNKISVRGLPKNNIFVVASLENMEIIAVYKPPARVSHAVLLSVGA
jgi:hypothetical protein